MTVAKMSTKTADVLLGGPQVSDFESDLYHLEKLADRILAAVADAGAVQFAFGTAGGASVEPVMPELEFTLPMPSWADA